MGGMPLDSADPTNACNPIVYRHEQPFVAPLIDRLVDAPGHTPGHVAVEVDTGDDTLLYVADAFVDELKLEHPDWTALFDTDAADTVASRRALLDRAEERGAIVAAFHVRRAGRSARAGDAYRFEPEA